MNYCKFCGKEIPKNRSFCSSKCQGGYRTKECLEEWQNGERTGISGEYKIADYVRNYMLKKADYKCEKCGWGKINPFTGKIPLEIHHIDGDYTNTVEENLQVLCPNCHALTNNFKGARTISGKGRPESKYSPRSNVKNFCIDCGCEITQGATRCRACANKNRDNNYILPISREELKALIRTESFVKIGKDYNLTDNGVRKWCDKYHLPRKKSDINKISDEDWQLI